MKYTDQQRLKKIVSTGEKLLQYLDENQISEQQILTDYPMDSYNSSFFRKSDRDIYFAFTIQKIKMSPVKVAF